MGENFYTQWEVIEYYPIRIFAMLLDNRRI